MHQLFTIAEVVDNIVKDIAHEHAPSPYCRSTRRGYTGFATDEVYKTIKALRWTSRLFEEATLDAIWETQRSILPLLGCIDLIRAEPREPTWGGIKYVRLHIC